MARRSRATGVGRGNGAGSARTQFRNGMPSANPNGRPRKEKELPARSIADAIEKILWRDMDVTDRSGTRKIPQFQAMLEYAVADFPRCSPAARLRLLQFCIDAAPEVLHAPPPAPDADRLRTFLETLAKEADE